MTESDGRASRPTSRGPAGHRGDPGAAVPLGQRHPGRHVRPPFTVSRAQLAAHLDLMLEQGLPADHRAAAAGRSGHGSAAAAHRW